MRGIKDKSTNLVVDKVGVADMGPVFENNSFRSSSSSVVTVFVFPNPPFPHRYKESGRNVLVLSLHVKQRQMSFKKATWKA